MKTLKIEILLPFEDEHVALIEQCAAARAQTSGDFMTELAASHVESITLLLLRDLKHLQQQLN